MSCPEVVYQTYYPYLYQRPSTSSASAARTAPFPPFHQYERLNVQRSLEQPSTSSEPVYLHHHASSHHSSAGSVSSGGGGVGSPGSPPPPSSVRHKDEDGSPSVEGAGASSSVGGGGGGGGQGGDEEGEEERSTAQYVSTNCVVFTHYTGDVASVVDEHFSRALSCAAAAASSASQDSKSSSASAKESSPMSTRNFPASFWNSNHQGGMSTHHGDLYGDPMYHGASSADPWHYQQYSAHHHRTVHEYHHHHHHNMAQYGGLILPPTTRLPPHVTAPHQYHTKPGVEAWTSSQHHRLHHDQAASHHSLEAATPSYASYPSMAG
ncbi:uncharacterized protein vg isoform X2 [Bemisia tabaci]|uniref:uncharacterized protein vg isoform X2 n=1 Tax=Bemisia tabaci TaxID=7038 RepID=UPI003B28BE65